MAQKFISLGNFASRLEAELSKNCLDSEGIRAMITSDSVDPALPFSLMVAEEDAPRAKACLEGAVPSSSETVPVPDAAEAARQLEEAGQEFEAYHRAELEQKVQGMKSAAQMGLIALAAAPCLYFLIPGKQLAGRAALACVLWAAIQFFVWKDAKQAEEELRKKNPPQG